MIWRGGSVRRLRRATEVDDGRAVVREISSDVEIMSNKSSSTYVYFNESPPPIAKARIGPELPKRSHRRASSLALNFEGPRSCSILQPLSPLSPIRKLDTGPKRAHTLGSLSIPYSLAKPSSPQARPTKRAPTDQHTFVGCAEGEERVDVS